MRNEHFPPGRTGQNGQTAGCSQVSHWRGQQMSPPGKPELCACSKAFVSRHWQMMFTDCCLPARMYCTRPDSSRFRAQESQKLFPGCNGDHQLEKSRSKASNGKYPTLSFDQNSHRTNVTSPKPDRTGCLHPNSCGDLPWKCRARFQTCQE